MPKSLERKLWVRVRTGKYRRWSSARKKRYVYGTLRKTGWVPSHQRKNRNPMRGYKKCILNALKRTKFSTPIEARKAMKKARKKCNPTRRVRK